MPSSEQPVSSRAAAAMVSHFIMAAVRRVGAQSGVFMSFPVDVVIMAAGKGTRMKSLRPKVLHRLAGCALVGHVIDCAVRLSARRAVVITGHGADQVEAALAPLSSAALPLQFVRQEPQLGTGHAVQQAVPVLADDGVTLVLSGDVPLTEAATLQALLDVCAG